MGFHTFAAGEVLTAANVNTYLMSQVVIVCTSGTRPASPVAGMTIYETDTTAFQVYTGVAWVQHGGSGVFAGSWSPGWSAGSTPATFSLNSGRYVRFGNLVIAHADITTSATATSGQYRSTLPFAPHATSYVNGVAALGSWKAAGTSAGVGTVLWRGTNTCGMNNGVATDVTTTIASGDSLSFALIYEAA